MKLKISILCSAMLLVSFVSVQAQPVVFYGLLIDKNSGLPVVSARITLRELKKETLSNENGQFTFLSIPSGSYTLSVYPLLRIKESSELYQFMPAIHCTCCSIRLSSILPM